mgnify:CR=1 FL=1
MGWRPHPKHADTDPDAPRAWATDDRSGFQINQYKMSWQYQWAGNQLINLRILVGPDNLDKPQEQLRTLILPPDPPPIYNARPEPYVMDETDWRTTQDDDYRITQNDELRVTQPSQYEATDESTG